MSGWRASIEEGKFYPPKEERCADCPPREFAAVTEQCVRCGGATRVGEFRLLDLQRGEYLELSTNTRYMFGRDGVDTKGRLKNTHIKSVPQCVACATQSKWATPTIAPVETPVPKQDDDISWLYTARCRRCKTVCKTVHYVAESDPKKVGVWVALCGKCAPMCRKCGRRYAKRTFREEPTCAPCTPRRPVLPASYEVHRYL